MKLWKLTSRRERPEWVWPYDKNHGFVVRAASEEEARFFASESASDEGAEAWMSPDSTLCELLTEDGEPGVCLQDFAQDRNNT